MRFQRALVALSIINLLSFGLFVTWDRTDAQSDVVPILRARVIELVDDKGKTRAQLAIEPTGETVLRMRDARGTIRTKLGAGEDGSGLSMMDDRTEATVQIRANKTGGGITLFDRDGKSREVR